MSPKVKRLISIAFVLLLLLNVMGYYGLFVGLEYRNDVAMNRRFESNQYSESRTVTIKIPLVVPYFGSSDEFQRVDGKFEHEGHIYRLIKQRYSNDTLTVVCYRDLQDGKLNEAFTDYVKTFRGNSNEDSSNSKLTITLIKDYLPQTFAIVNNCFGWQSDVLLHSTPVTFISSFSPSFVHPPERG